MHDDNQGLMLMQNRLVSVVFEMRRQRAKLHAFAKHLMGMAHRIACMLAHKLVRFKCVLQQK